MVLSPSLHEWDLWPTNSNYQNRLASIQYFMSLYSRKLWGQPQWYLNYHLGCWETLMKRNVLCTGWLNGWSQKREAKLNNGWYNGHKVWVRMLLPFRHSFLLSSLRTSLYFKNRVLIKTKWMSPIVWSSPMGPNHFWFIEGDPKHVPRNNSVTWESVRIKSIYASRMG